MPAKVLVTYASRAGSTAGIAQAIYQTLIGAGVSAEIHPMQSVTDLTPYHAVIAGSAVHREKWLPEAMDFMRQHQAALKQKPFAAFLVCLALSRPTRKAQQNAQAWLQPVRALVPPVSEGYFAGALDLRKVPPAYRILFRVAVTLRLWAEGDYRDWDAVQRWAAELPAHLRHP